MDWYGFFWAIQETWSWHIMIFDVKKSGFCFLPELLLLNSSICQLLLDGARTALLGFHPNWSGDSPQFHGSPHLVVNEYDFFSTCQWFFRDIYIYCQYNIFLGMYMYIIIYIYIQYTIWYHLTGEFVSPIPYTYAIPLEKSLASLGSLWLCTSMVAASASWTRKDMGKCAQHITAFNKWYKWYNRWIP